MSWLVTKGLKSNQLITQGLFGRIAAIFRPEIHETSGRVCMGFATQGGIVQGFRTSGLVNETIQTTGDLS